MAYALLPTPFEKPPRMQYSCGSMKRQRVLVIEDEVAAMEALVNLLIDEGFDVLGASTGEEGVAAYPTFRPDIIFCDYQLPDLTGLDVLRRIRAISSGGRFILLTSGVGDPQCERSLRTEADGFLVKPLDLAQLHDTLATAA